MKFQKIYLTCLSYEQKCAEIWEIEVDIEEYLGFEEYQGLFVDNVPSKSIENGTLRLEFMLFSRPLQKEENGKQAASPESEN